MRLACAAALLASAALLDAVAQEIADPSPAFYRVEAARARTALDGIPERGAILDRIRALSESAPIVTQVKLAGKRVFYLKLAPRQSTPMLYVREGLTGAERVIIDPARFAQGPVGAAIDWYAPSPDGRHVAYGVSLGGGEDSVLRVFAIDAHRDLPVEIDRARFNARLAWHPDGRAFYYARVAPGIEGPRRFANIRLYHHVLGREASRDEIVFAPGVGGARDVPDFAYPSLHVPLESRYAYAVVREGVRRDVAVHVAEQSDLAKGRPRWRKVAGYEDGITAIEGWKDDLLLLTHNGAPNFHVMRMKATASLGTARSVVPEGDAVIEQIALARDAIYLRTTVGGVDRLEKTPSSLFAVRARQYVRLPFDNAISELIADPRAVGVMVRLQGWIEPPAIVQVDARGDMHKTGLQAPPTVDFSGMDEVRLYTKSGDGTSIPVTLVYGKSTTLNGRNPTILTAYGSYGVTLSPVFDASLLAWLELGGVYAVAHVRGGGEHGLAWHMAGMRAQKANTIQDFIAVAEFLVSYGFTSPAKLAAVGTGAGAIPVGGALARRPDLFAAVVLRSPMTDLLQLEATPSGPANLPEFGSSTTSEGAAALRAASPLHQLKDATTLPAVLLTAAAVDPWVPLSQPGRMAARLQAVNPAGKPVLLRIDDAAHASRTREQHDQDLADIYAFLVWQFDAPPPIAPPPAVIAPPAPAAPPADAAPR